MPAASHSPHATPSRPRGALRGALARHAALVVCLFFCAFGAIVAAPSGPVKLDFTPFGSAHAENASTGAAPADESFGLYPMSIMGIDNAIRRYDGFAPLDEGPIAYALVAIRDWEARFPRDPWIARELFALQRVYEFSRTYEGVPYAQHVARWLQTDYPGGRYAILSSMEFVCAARGGC